MRTLISGGIIVNEGKRVNADIIINDDRIETIAEGNEAPRGIYDETIDATGCFVLPGIIDEHVHFREPGMTEKATIESESRAAAYGGVTTYFDMPNTNPTTTTIDALADKFERAGRDSHVNYSFFFGATNNNVQLFESLDRHRIPGIKLFMGSSTGNMLVDNKNSLRSIFKTCAELNLPLMVHCEDTGIINENMKRAKVKYGDDPDIQLHPLIRSEEACWKSSCLAASLAHKYGTKLHIAHVTTAKELVLANSMAQDNITLEAVIAHLYFTSGDYATKGALIKCNPAVKTRNDRDELRRALSNGRITTVATDHAPHLLSQKQGGCAKAASGMPMVQFSLPTMLELVDGGVLTIERLVELMAHNPARLFSINERGFIRKGYKADLVIVRPNVPWTVDKSTIQSSCKWSPMEGHKYQWRVETTMCNGTVVYDKGKFNEAYRGEAVLFRS